MSPSAPRYMRNVELGIDRPRKIRAMRFVYSRYELVRIRVWDTFPYTEGSCRFVVFQLKVVLGHTCSVYNGFFDRTGNVFFTGGDDSLVKVWCAKTGWLVRSIRGHQTFTTSQVSESNSRDFVFSSYFC